MLHFYQNLLEAIRDRQKMSSERVLSGVFTTFEEYKLTVGRLKGLMDAENIIKSVFSKMTETKTVYDARLERSE